MYVDWHWWCTQTFEHVSCFCFDQPFYQFFMGYSTIFHHFASASVYTAYYAWAAQQVRLHSNFFKLTDTWSEVGHETCSSSGQVTWNFFTYFCVEFMNFRWNSIVGENFINLKKYCTKEINIWEEFLSQPSGIFFPGTDQFSLYKISNFVEWHIKDRWTREKGVLRQK